MALIFELLIVFAAAAAIGLIWQKASGFSWGRSLHRALVIGMLSMLVFFIALVILNVAGLRPTPEG